MSKAIKYGLLGLLCGSLAYLVFSILLSWKLGTGEFYFTIPALVNEYGNELLSGSLQILTFLWLGMASGVAFSMTENMDWSPQKQSAGYLLTLTIGLIPTAFVVLWSSFFVTLVAKKYRLATMLPFVPRMVCDSR